MIYAYIPSMYNNFELSACSTRSRSEYHTYVQRLSLNDALTRAADNSPVQSVTCRADISHYHLCKFEHDASSHSILPCNALTVYCNATAH